jgi:hypothetical protein
MTTDSAGTDQRGGRRPYVKPFVCNLDASDTEGGAKTTAPSEVPAATEAATVPAAAAMAASTSAVTVKAWSAPGAARAPPLTVKSSPVSDSPRAVPMPRLMFKTPEAIPACPPEPSP